jgi:polysaccharide export outer membrane protein
MTSLSLIPAPVSPSSENRSRSLRRLSSPALAFLLGLSFLFLGAGCETPVASGIPVTGQDQAEVLTLHEGDVLKIAFPGAPNLDTSQQIRRDGRITMPIVGEIVAAGKTPTQLESELAGLYASQLVSKEVSVTVVSSSYAVYVSGAVMHPGKIMADRPLTALEAIMEAGGFDNTSADMEGVVVIRKEGDKTVNHTVNLKLVLEGKATGSFYLKPSDILYVPKKFSWF